MNNAHGAADQAPGEERRIAELRRQKRRAMSMGALGVGAFTGGVVLFFGVGWLPAASLCILGVVKAWSDLSQRLLELDLEIAFAEIDRMAEQEKWARGAASERVAQRQMVLAGIEFNTPAGRFEEEVVYRYAVKDGRVYEYAGLAGSMDEPGPNMLIVNELIYRPVAA